MTESADTYPMPKHGWTCFFCGETFKTVGGAGVHFGANSLLSEPGCLKRVQLGDERGWLMEIRKLEQLVEELRRENEQLNHEAGSYHSMVAELERCFDGARTVREAWLKLEVVEGRVIAAESKHPYSDLGEALRKIERLGHSTHHARGYSLADIAGEAIAT